MDMMKSNVNANNGLAVNMVTSRQGEEVKGAIFMAKQFPRDTVEASNKIIKMCERKSLAEVSQYTYPRGGQTINGPSIRLAEAIAQSWGNIDYGIIELSNSNGLSEMMAYAWDLETNVRRTMVFSVKHERKAKGVINNLTDSRDIYELTANMGSRRVRACILGIIPGDIIDEAIETCKKTLTTGESKNLDDQIKKMLMSFDKQFKITRKQIEEFVGFGIENFDESNLFALKGVFDSIKDGMAKREDYFNFNEPVNPFSKENKEMKKEEDEEIKPPWEVNQDVSK